MTLPSTLLTPTTSFPVVGMIGGGQLARMTGQAAASLGIGFRVLAASADESAARSVREIVVGDPDNPKHAAEFAAQCDVVTFDHEQVPEEVLSAMVQAGAVLRPGPEALIYAQDKAAMRERLSQAGLPSPQWQVVAELSEAIDFAKRVGYPIVLKLSRGGYDGRGVWVCHSESEIQSTLEAPLPTGACWLAEEKVEFTQELAAVVVRSASGESVGYPVVRTVQTNGMCTEVVAPAPGLPPEHARAAQQIAIQVADLVSVVGVLAVEMFDTDDGVLINELAMRPHNSGHWSIDGAVTSQFENHLRAVLGMPLGDTGPRQPWTVMVNVVGGEGSDLFAATGRAMGADPKLKVHLYAKQPRPGRKLGHVNVCGEDLEPMLARAHRAANQIAGGTDE
jgi:5-(carboxyamino)imidazole ribonucleotide synthase